jgi:NADH:ubiquinone oxidoreductase subunit E
VTVLSSLLAVQDEIHHIPSEAVEETAAFLDVTMNEVWSVASFYTNFRSTPPGARTVDVCWGPSCHLNGAQRIIDAVRKRMGLETEGDTADGKLTLRFSTCLGACAVGPVIAVDHHLQGRSTPESAVETVGRLMEEDAE